MLNVETLKCSYVKEEILIILFTRLYFGTQGIEEIQDFLDHEVIDWNLFYKLVSYNDIRGFVYDIITISKISIDRQIYDTLKKDVMAISLFGSYQANLINHLTAEFEKLAITVIPYKGHTLAARYYKSPLLRESSDIDFLIDKDDLFQIRKCLHENGYESKFSLADHQIGFVLSFHRELSFKSPKDKMGITSSVELQWKLLEGYLGKFPRYDFFVQHLQSYTTMDGTLHIGLTPTYDFLCVASHHLIREPLLRFKYLIDLAAMIQTSSSQLDWEEINLHFKRYKFSVFLASGVSAITEIIGLQLPVSDSPAVAYHLFAATEMRSSREGFFRKNRLIYLKQSFLERIKLKVRIYLFLLIPNINDLSLTTAPAWTIPFITPLKSFRFLYRHLTKKN